MLQLYGALPCYFFVLVDNLIVDVVLFDLAT
jgi:hypothetical protein